MVCVAGSFTSSDWSLYRFLLHFTAECSCLCTVTLPTSRVDLLHSAWSTEPPPGNAVSMSLTGPETLPCKDCGRSYGMSGVCCWFVYAVRLASDGILWLPSALWPCLENINLQNKSCFIRSLRG
eukprot:GHVQ01040080.1.p2 GENE.GHVQ01040080.1~~GHVQ01040080.1.p2  ORF type:complete len:124 (-),score=4.44 GHVQ01040080.1:2223-2594(-)